MADDVLRDHLILEYQGPRVEAGSMDARTVATNIIAFSDFLDVLSTVTYGQKIEVHTEVQGFRGDSFDIDFLFRVAGHVATMLAIAPASPRDLIELIMQSVDLWKHLGGEPPKATNEVRDNGQFVKVENSSGNVIVINNSVLNFVIDPAAGEAVERFVREPLQAGGIDSVAISSREFKETARIEKSEARAFRRIDVEQPLGQVELESYLVVESPTFKEGNKWKFFDGQASFYADMADEEFLQAINEGSVRFGKGDTLKVRMVISQASAPGRLSAERTIVKVLEHRIASEQRKLPW